VTAVLICPIGPGHFRRVCSSQAWWAEERKADDRSRAHDLVVARPSGLPLAACLAEISEFYVASGGLKLPEDGHQPGREFSVKGTWENAYNVSLSGTDTIFFTSIFTVSLRSRAKSKSHQAEVKFSPDIRSHGDQDTPSSRLEEHWT